MLTLYEILNIPAWASTSEVKSSFYKLAQKYHPDKNRNPGTVKKFRAVHRAYQILSDQEKRTQYDQQLVNMVFVDDSNKSTAETTSSDTDAGFFMSHFRRLLWRPYESVREGAWRSICVAKTFLWAALELAKERALCWIMVPVNLFHMYRRKAFSAKELTLRNLRSMKRQWQFLLNATVRKIQDRKNIIRNKLRNLVQVIFDGFLAQAKFLVWCRRKARVIIERKIHQLAEIEKHAVSIFRAAVLETHRKKEVFLESVKSVGQKCSRLTQK